MGWCHDFNVEITEGCSHPMRAGVSYCTCTECGVVCHGKFDACKEVWIKLPSRSKRSASRGGRDERPTAPELVSPAPSRTVRLSEPVEVPDAGTTRPPRSVLEPPPGATPTSWEGERSPFPSAPAPAPPAPAPATRAEGAILPDTVLRAAARLVEGTVAAASEEQADAIASRIDDLRRELVGLVAVSEAHAAAAVRRADGLAAEVARRDEEVAAHLGSLKAGLDAMRRWMDETAEFLRTSHAPAEADARARQLASIQAAADRLSDGEGEIRAQLASQQALLEDLQHAVAELAVRLRQPSAPVAEAAAPTEDGPGVGIRTGDRDEVPASDVAPAPRHHRPEAPTWIQARQADLARRVAVQQEELDQIRANLSRLELKPAGAGTRRGPGPGAGEH
jgi:hypothetical protein